MMNPGTRILPRLQSNVTCPPRSCEAASRPSKAQALYMRDLRCFSQTARDQFGLTFVTTWKMRREGDPASVPDDNVALLLWPP
jgi:hypothetical protein